jgi:hypothetical protein
MDSFRPFSYLKHDFLLFLEWTVSGKPSDIEKDEDIFLEISFVYKVSRVKVNLTVRYIYSLPQSYCAISTCARLMRRTFYCIIQIYDDNESSMDPVLLSIKKDNELCHGGNFYLKISVVIVDGETINSGQRNPKHLVE